MHFLAKVRPTPVGATADNLREWLASQSIHGKLIRAKGTKSINRGELKLATWVSQFVSDQDPKPFVDLCKTHNVAHNDLIHIL